jgi:hypothetical protein
MSQTDSQPPQPREPRIPPRYLPDIVGLKIERVHFEPPKHRFVRSVYAEYREALAFVLDIRGDLRLDQNVTPVLYVGDVEVSHAESVDRYCVRFLAFPDEERRMKPGASIALGWPGLPLEKRESKFIFSPPDPPPTKP